MLIAKQHTRRYTLMFYDSNEMESNPVPTTVIATIKPVRQLANVTFDLAISYINNSSL